jgi:hypothetical protein
MEHAVELAHSSKSFHSMVCRRLEIISHEDCDTTDRTIVPFVKACVEQAAKWYDVERIGASRMAIGNAIRAMARSRSHAQAIPSVQKSDCVQSLNASCRRYQTLPMTSTRWKAAGADADCNISVMKVRC